MAGVTGVAVETACGLLMQDNSAVTCRGRLEVALINQPVKRCVGQVVVGSGECHVYQTRETKIRSIQRKVFQAYCP